MLEPVVKSFYELSHEEIFMMFKARVDVFVVEQECAYPEIDDIDRDLNTRHLLFLEHGCLKAYARCYPKSENTASIGRVLITPDGRGAGMGYTLMNAALACCHQQFPQMNVQIAAQSYLQPFYGKLGFEPISDVYLEDGIEHLDMQLKQGN
ncbi:GCN5 family acetyltransferase [Pseudoalteromonas luteoviolacea]|uniref:GCN5 family acetyltransferase n=1 Tax=Pseudoalteromonas luteoviolacea TaxID=43657 RepID=A0A1C0TMH1_9GAMM|nr:GNAT family N-acetyltransferase [Pseudoalteromonas luteoviolacea]MBQ4812390.1 GNAT family N-acetyltransferase [Pseudoalteromonas luteoviolacea]OCQ19877.1 GCN5 family acetyltransferase [Pseudoalteromonas luteoviolacea]